MTLVALVNQLLSLLTIFAHIIIVVLVTSFFLPIKIKKKVIDFFVKHAFILAFIVAVTATTGSLFYSEIAGYEPCKLCWYQRIFMYPQAILFGLSLWKKDKGIIDYSIILSVIGALIAGYHYLLQLGIAPSVPCSAVGYSVLCSKRFVLQYGYITIPLMAFTAFLLLLLLMVSVKIYRKK